MSTICEHEFDQPDPKNPEYSSTEFDLIAKLQMTIRKNLKTGRFEIVKIGRDGELGEVQYSGDFELIVKTARQLEGADYIQIKCGMGCPRRREV